MSIHRAIVHVAGPRGAGKTTLLERLLESNRSKLLFVARCEEVPGLRAPKETPPRRDAELLRLARAGAVGVVRYRFSRDGREDLAFFESRLLADYSQGVLVEGDLPLSYPPDLVVFVARPPAKGERLLRRARVDETSERAADLAQAEELLANPDAFGALLARMLGGAAGYVKDRQDVLADAGAHVREALRKAKSRRPAKGRMRWTLAEDYAGIERAQAIAIHAQDEDERKRGEAMLAEIARLRSDEQVFRDVLGWRGTRVPVTARVVDLADRRDAGLRALLARIKRVFASVR